MKKAIAILLCGATFALVSGRASRAQDTSASDPLDRLVGKRTVLAFVIGGGYFSFRKCSEVSIVRPTSKGVSVSVSCGEVGDYALLLKHGSDAKTYLMSVKSKFGISVEDFPVTYDGQGWRGVRELTVDGLAQSVTAMVVREKPGETSDWKVEVLPTAAINLKPGDIKKPYLSVNLNQLK